MTFAALAYAGCNKSGSTAAAARDSGSTDASLAAAVPSSEPAAETTPQYEVVDLTALDVLLKANRGKTVVINFWATWCPPCVQEMPEFVEFYAEHKGDEGVVLLSVTADDPSTIDTAIKPFVANHKIPFPIHVMNFMPSEELTGVLGYEWVDGNLPATFVYKPDGSLQNVWFVQITKADLDKAVAKAAGAA